MKINNFTKGIIWILISGISFSLMSLFVKLSGDLPVIQKSFFRNIIAGSIAIIPLIKHLKKINYPKIKKEWYILFLRSIFGTIGLLLNFYAITKIHLTDASVIQRLSPFVILILSFIFFKEKLNYIQIFAICSAFLGILLIVKPNYLGFMNIGAIFALLGAFCAGASYTALRYLGIASISGEFIVFFFSMFSSVALLPMVIFNYTQMTLYQFLMLVMIGISGAGGQFGITYAYKYAAAKNLAVFDYLQVVFSGFLGFYFFDEIPDFYSLLGYIIIILMGFLVVFKK